jgi:Fic family protein
LNGVARQSEDAVDRAERINRQLDEWRRRVQQSTTGVALRLLELLGSNPFITARKAQAQLGVAYNTAAGALRLLTRIRVVKQIGEGRRDRVFCAQTLLDILEEPARLHPAGSRI